MNLIFFGPPGAGKGTQSALLRDRLHLRHISTGDLFRHAIKGKTPLGLEAQAFTDRGELVPDRIVIGMVDEALSHLDGQGFILDGFPRTTVQADALTGILQRLRSNLDRVVFLSVPDDALIRRLTGRRVCKNCGTVFHVDAKPTRAAGVCDNCGGQTEQRVDDREEVISRRLQAYYQSTNPLLEYYRKTGSLMEVDGLGDEADVLQRILKGLEKR